MKIDKSLSGAGIPFPAINLIDWAQWQTVAELQFRHIVLGLCHQRSLKAKEAQRLMRVKSSQFYRLLARYRAGGPSKLVSPPKRRQGNNRIPDELKQRALHFIRNDYYDHGPTLVSELLNDSHSIRISPSTARRWMIDANLWIPKSASNRKFYQPRERKSAYGLQIQIDGSYHAWFEDRGPKCTVMVFVDDATGRWQILRFFRSETGAAYVECTKKYIRKYGCPVQFVTDKFSGIRSEHQDTAFENGLAQLHIVHTPVNSAQSKGRVENKHRTLQDRLVKYFRHAGINTIEQANMAADRFCAKFNRLFARPAINGTDAHRSLSIDVDLDTVFAGKVVRKLSHQLTFQMNRRRYAIKPTRLTKPHARNFVEVTNLNGAVFVRIPNGQMFQAREC